MKPKYSQLRRFLSVIIVMKKLFLVVFAGFASVSTLLFGQSVSINDSGAPAASSSILDVSSTNSGVLIPRMTAAERSAIASPAQGLLVYQTTEPGGFYYNQGTAVAPNWLLLQPGENVTTQGNTFNGPSQLTQLDASGRLPALDGSQLTNLSGSAFSFLHSGWFTNPESGSFALPIVYSNVQPAATSPFDFTDINLITFHAPTNCTIDHLLVKQIPSSGGSTGPITVTLYKNDVATSLSCTFTNVLSGVGQATDNNPAHAVSVTPSDRLYFRVSQESVGINTIFRLSTTVRVR